MSTMRKWLIGISGLIVAAGIYVANNPVARATVTCSVPFTFTAGTTAVASQVNSNFSAILACFANAASSGANSDITSLTGLTTPLSPSQGGTAVFVGTTTGGSANAQTLASTSPNSFALTSGYRVTFIAGFTNTAAMTLNVHSAGLVNVFRKTQLGATATVGGEIIAGNPYTVVYNGTNFVLDTETIYVGVVKDYVGSAAPAGYLLANAACVSRTTYADLFAIIGTAFDPSSICAGTDFRLPFGGVSYVGSDNGALISTSCANNIIAGTGSTTRGTLCGAQQKAILQANLPAVNFTGALPNHTHDFTAVLGLSSDQGPSSNIFTYPQGGQVGTTGGPSAATVSVSSGGSGTALATLPPVQIVNKIIRY
jgi:hypothetical protein